jgi:hypothetical protein
MSLPENQRIELKLQEEILKSEDALVKWIQTALDDKQSYNDLEEAQFRNLVRVAATTESPEVIKNFLRYQVGREKKWGRGEGSLAEKIIQNIDTEIQNQAKSICDSVNGSASKFKSIWIELIRRYLGYGARYLKYLNDGQ